MIRKWTILQPKTQACIVCGDPRAEIHHVYPGIPNRKHCDEDGLWVWACPYHHRQGAESFHFNRQMDLKLKRYAQKVYEKDHTREEFIERYGKSYL